MLDVTFNVSCLPIRHQSRFSDGGALHLPCLLLGSLADMIRLPEVKEEVIVIPLCQRYSPGFQHAYVASCFRKCEVRCHDDQSSPKSWVLSVESSELGSHFDTVTSLKHRRASYARADGRSD